MIGSTSLAIKDGISFRLSSIGLLTTYKKSKPESDDWPTARPLVKLKEQMTRRELKGLIRIISQEL